MGRLPAAASPAAEPMKEEDLGKAIVTQWYVAPGDRIKEDMPHK